MLTSILRWIDGEHHDDNGNELTAEANPINNRSALTLMASTDEPRNADDQCSNAVPSLPPIKLSDLEERRESAVKSKGPSREVHVLSKEFVADQFGKIIPGRNTIMFDTKTHRQIMSILLEHAEALSSAGYVNESGTCSSMLVGAKGIGKTECFLNFMHLANTIVANVIVVYVDYSGVGSEDSIFQAESLSATLCREVSKYGVHVVASNPTETPRPLSYRLLDALRRAGLRLLLLVDELDQLYRCKLNPENLISTLSELANFGTQKTGRVAVVLCGSSTMMEDLISGSASSLVRKEFPLSKCGVPNLNATKYRTKRVHSITPVNLKALASMLRMKCSHNRRPYLRLVAYRTGCKPRNVRRLLEEIRSGSVTQRLVSSEFSINEGNGTANAAFRKLRDVVLNLLRDANQSLLKDVFGDGDKSEADIVEAICMMPWETRLIPVMYTEVEESWMRLTQGGGEFQDLRRFDPLYGVLHLVDGCSLVIDDFTNGTPERIYPCSFESMIGTVASDLKRHSVWRQSQDALLGMITKGEVASGYETVMRASRTTAGATTPSLYLFT